MVRSGGSQPLERNSTTGIAQISTNGKLGQFIPTSATVSAAAGPNGQLWMATGSPALVLATRSGVVVTQDPPGLSVGRYAYGQYGAQNTISAGPDGNLWLTDGKSSIERINGLGTLLGSLDCRHRPERAPDYVYDPSTLGDQWTNITENPRPTFAGVAIPGAEVTLWAQKQGENSPVAIGQVEAGKSDGTWTLKSQVKLTSGNYAITATQTGDTGPPSILYSLVPDSSGNLSSSLVIQAPHGSKVKA
jgi:hypothetical protein